MVPEIEAKIWEPLGKETGIGTIGRYVVKAARWKVIWSVALVSRIQRLGLLPSPWEDWESRMKGEVDTEFTTGLWESFDCWSKLRMVLYSSWVKQKDLVDVGDDVESDCVESRTAELALDWDWGRPCFNQQVSIVWFDRPQCVQTRLIPCPFPFPLWSYFSLKNLYWELAIKAIEGSELGASCEMGSKTKLTISLSCWMIIEKTLSMSGKGDISIIWDLVWEKRSFKPPQEQANEHLQKGSGR